MNKTHQELCDEIIRLREQLEAAQASINLARLAKRQALAKAEELERERDALTALVEKLRSILEPFAQAWSRRQPKGDPGTTAYQRRLERALGVFYSNGNMDDRALTGEHLREAARIMSPGMSDSGLHQREIEGGAA